MKPATWKIELRAPAGDTDEQATRRVRAALKTLLRSFGLTATLAVKVDAEKRAHDGDVSEVTK